MTHTPARNNRRCGRARSTSRNPKGPVVPSLVYWPGTGTRGRFEEKRTKQNSVFSRGKTIEKDLTGPGEMSLTRVRVENTTNRIGRTEYGSERLETVVCSKSQAWTEGGELVSMCLIQSIEPSRKRPLRRPRER